MTTMIEHHQAQTLLPWYATGTLDEHDMKLVETHLGHCSECARDVALAVQTAQQLQMTDVFETTLANQQSANFKALTTQLEHDAPSRFRVDIPLAAAILCGVLVLTFSLSGQRDESLYDLMTQSSGGVDHSVVQIIFHPQTPEQDVRLLLLDMGGELTGSPSPRGVYRVRLTTRHDVNAYVRRLQQHPAVRWAELEL